MLSDAILCNFVLVHLATIFIVQWFRGLSGASVCVCVCDPSDASHLICRLMSERLLEIAGIWLS